MKRIINFLFIFLIMGGITNMTACKETEDTKTNTLTNENQIIEEDYTGFKLEKKLFKLDESIKVTIKGYNNRYAIGLYDSIMYEPGRQDLFSTPKLHFKQIDIKRGVEEYEIKHSYFKTPGEYYLYLYNTENYQVEQKEVIRFWDEDSTDYKIKSAVFSISNNIPTITIQPSEYAIDKELTYRFYWIKDKVRLKDYTNINQVKYIGTDEFSYFFNQNLFMPNEANGIEIEVFDGLSTSYFLDIDSSLKLKESNYLYSFQAISDLHIETFSWQPYYANHLIEAFKDIKNLSPNTIGIFVVGDITNQGKEEEYNVYHEILNNAFPNNKPNIYYALGNHEYFHGTYSANQWQTAIDLYYSKTKMENIYYSVEMQGSKFIFLGSESSVGEGTMTDAQINWFKNELLNTNKDMPVYVFLHQSIYNTISGSLPGQNWHGFIDDGDELRQILKYYPNAIVFSGHSHWELDSKTPVLLGNGNEANYVNCASVGYLWNDNDQNEMGSEGIFVEVYEDYILIKGREFTEHKWVSSTQIVINR